MTKRVSLRQRRRAHFLKRLRERFGITGSMKLADQVEQAIGSGAGYGPIRSDIQYDGYEGCDWYYLKIATDRQEPALVLVGWHRVMRCPVTCLWHTRDMNTYRAAGDARKAGLVPVEYLVIKRKVVA